MKSECKDRQFDFTKPTLIVGMGKTGLSCARYLQSKNTSFALADSRDKPSQLELFKSMFQNVELFTGAFKERVFDNYQQILVSPGVPIRNEFFNKQQLADKFILGDIELFAQQVTKPVIAITGSNGKSTVTTLVGEIIKLGEMKVAIGGNLGMPALDLINDDVEVYVLELSSFQLETTYSLKTISATVLNISDDHLDRYKNISDYRTVKEKIYHHCDYKVVNRAEKTIVQQLKECKTLSFGNDKPEQENYGLVSEAAGMPGQYLVKGKQLLLEVQEIKLKGRFNYENILASLALVEPLKLPLEKQLEAIRNFNGLPYRCEWIAEIDGVKFYNDSKGTNTGATISAILGFKEDIILIAGGMGKGADFTELGTIISQRVKAAILLGTDARLIAKAIIAAGVDKHIIYPVKTLREAVLTAFEIADPGGIVLLSPACASFDMYENYIARGEDFNNHVAALLNTRKGQFKNVS